MSNPSNVAPNAPLSTPPAARPAPVVPPVAAPSPPAPGQPTIHPGTPAPKQGMNGCLKAFIIGSVVMFALSCIVVVGLVFVGKKAAEDIDKTFGVAAAGDYELKTDTCNVDDFNNPQAMGTITNKTNHKQAFEIKIDFVSDANVKVSNGLTFSGSLDPGQTGNWRIPTFDDAGNSPITCKVTEVSYTPFSS